MPYLQRAVAFRYKLFGAAAHVSKQFAELSDDGMIFFDVQGRVVHVNGITEKILTGTRMDISNGSLLPPHDWLQRALSAALKRLPTQTDEPCVYTIPVYGKMGHWSLRFTPIAGSLRDEVGFAALLLISAPVFAANATAVSILGQRYHLTPVEIALVEALVAGRHLKQFAEQACISYETARSHLKSIFKKTGTHRQADLILLMTGIANPD